MLVAKLAHEAGVLPLQVGAEALATRARVIGSHARALHDYIAARTDARVVLIKAEQSDGDPSNGWGEHLPELELHTSPGDHYSMLEPPNVDVLCSLLEKVFAK